jgi:hypothetical protein
LHGDEMSELFIANPTKQNNHFFYQVPETRRMQNVVIPKGGQLKIPGGLTRAQLDGIVDQHREHGMIPASGVSRFSSEKIMLIYQFDKPIDMDSIHYRMDKNDAIALAVSDQVRVEATEYTVHDLAKTTGAEPETAEVILSEVDNSAGKHKTTVVRLVSKK